MNQRRLYDTNFLLAFLSQSFFTFANSLALAHFARWVAFLGGDERDVGYVVGLSTLGALILRPWMAQWIDGIGSRRIWGIGLAIYCPVLLVYLLVGSPSSPFLYLLRMLTTASAAMIFAGGLTYISQMAPPERRAEAIGALGAGGFVGMFFGPRVGDALLGAAGERTFAAFAWTFGAAAFATALAVALLIPLRPEPKSDHRRSFRLSDFLATITSYWPGSVLLMTLAFGACMTVPFSFLAKYVDEMGSGDVGVFFFYCGFGLPMRLLLLRVPTILGPRTVLIAGTITMAIGMFSFPFDPAWPVPLVIPAILCGTGHALMFHTMVSLAIETFPNEKRGSGSVLALMGIDIGTFTSAPILGVVAARIGGVLGYHWLFSLVGVACLLAASIHLLAISTLWKAPKTDDHLEPNLRPALEPAGQRP